MVEKAKYEIIEKNNDFEIRKYPEMILATVEGYNEDNVAFNYLFNYISGNNKSQKKIEMTAPVISSEKIDMTAPVISKKDFFAFVMPSKYNKNNVPTPLNPKVQIRIEPEKKLAVIRFGGYSTDKKISKYKELLLTGLKSKNIKTKADPVLMRYNSPFAPPFFRRNEIGVEIEYD